MRFIDVYKRMLISNCVIAIFLSGLFTTLTIRFTRCSIGKYKYLLITFSIFNILYACVLFLGMPIHYISNNSWLIVGYGILKGTAMQSYMTGLYCTFYEIWIILLDIHFIYRYVVVCRPDFVAWIQRSYCANVYIWFIIISAIIYTVTCGVIFCTRDIVTPEQSLNFQKRFGVEPAENYGYILMRTKDIEENVSIAGTLSLVDHAILVLSSFVLCVVFGYLTWMGIDTLRRKGNVSLYTIQLQKQLLRTLTIQTFFPFFLCHLPTILFVAVPLTGLNITFGIFSLSFAYLNSVSKFVDPILYIVFLTDYRTALKRLFGGYRSQVKAWTVANSTFSLISGRTRT